jgi:hypothetical protein
MNYQQTFLEIAATDRIKALTINQRKIIGLVGLHLTQSDIAKKLGFSRAYINQTIKRLESLGLIKKDKKGTNGTRDYNHFYEVSPDVKIPGIIFTPFRAHHFIRKFKIVRQSGPVSTDKRVSHSKSWSMRSKKDIRHKYWYMGKAGLPSVTIDWHPGTIVVYVDKGQKIPARTTEEAKQLGWYAVNQAKDRFIEEQLLFGVEIEIENVGQQIGKVHMGLEGDEQGPLASIKQAQDLIPEERVMGVKNPVWFDKSNGKGKLELEMFEDHPDLTPAEQAIKTIADLPEVVKKIMPEIMKEIDAKINPMSNQMAQLVSQLQGGRPIEVMFQNALDMMLRMMEKMDRMDDEIRVLKGGK